jgi:hypothetical protein
VLNVNKTKVTIVMLIAILVLLAVTNVSLVKDLLTIVPNVYHQELIFHNVTVQMDSSIMETLVLVVLINVLLVLPEKNVLPVLMLESISQLVIVQLDILMLVKLLVMFVHGLVLLVLLLTSVLNVIMPQKDLVQVVIVQKTTEMLLMVLLVVMKWIILMVLMN